MSSYRLPTPAPDDHEDVVLALHTAAALWGRGDTHDAVHWVRRAATSAEENGADMRAVALARAAADLTTELAVPASTRSEAAPSPPLAPPTSPNIGGFAPAAPVRPSDPGGGLMDADDTDKTLVDQSPAARAQASPAVLAMPRAYRVVVGPAAEPGSLTVRVLAENEAAPSGTKEAVLLALDWELDLSEPGS